jgi:hypothetical protein
VVVSSAISSMIAHWAAGRSETPSASATAHASTIAASSLGRHSGIVRSSPTVRPETTVRGERAIRASLCHRTRFSSGRPARRSARAEGGRRPLDLVPSEALGGDRDDRATVASMIWTRPAR